VAQRVDRELARLVTTAAQDPREASPDGKFPSSQVGNIGLLPGSPNPENNEVLAGFAPEWPVLSRASGAVRICRPSSVIRRLKISSTLRCAAADLKRRDAPEQRPNRMFVLLIVFGLVFGAGFAVGYLLRDQISVRRRRRAKAW
jgi:hypothetical protein